MPYATLHRFAVAELGFGRGAATVGIVDGEPGQELQVDTGWVGWLRSAGPRRRFRAWIFTAVRSRHRFVYPVFRETTATAIEACEAAWAFFGGIFHVLIPDNTKAIVRTPDDLEPQLVEAFLEYAQARDFQIDPTRVRHPKDKARVERTVPGVRDDCFAGEDLIDLEAARACGRHWCLDDYGQRRHSRTQRRPLEHFEAEERAVLLPAPSEPYDSPLWNTPKVGRDHYALVADALYSLPTRVDRRPPARPRRPRHRALLPPRRRWSRRIPAARRAASPIARRRLPDRTHRLRPARHRRTCRRRPTRTARPSAASLHALLDGPLPWTRMRRVYALLGLARRYGSGRVNEACALALVVGMLDVHRLQRMLVLAVAAPPPTPAARAARSVALSPARHAVPARPRALDRHTRRRPRMTPDPISPDLRTVLRRLKLSRMLDTLPERLSLARQQKTAAPGLPPARPGRRSVPARRAGRDHSACSAPASTPACSSRRGIPRRR